MNKWTKITDQRPPFMEMVIFYDGHNVWPGWDEANADEDLSICCADPAFRRCDEDPIYWTLLPAPPEAEWLDKIKTE